MGGTPLPLCIPPPHLQFQVTNRGTLLKRRSLPAVLVRGCRQLTPRRPVRAHNPGAAVSYSYSTTPTRRQNAFHSQLESTSTPAFDSAPRPSQPSIPQTLTEKIVQRYAVGLPEGKRVKAGDYVTIRPGVCMTHDNTFPVMRKFESIGASKVHDNKQIIITLDHQIQDRGEANLKKYSAIHTFAQKHGIQDYEAGRGIGHQIMVEEGHAWPGTLAVASDSHSNTYGALSCLGTPVVRSDAASIYATGKTWWCIPPVAKVTLTGVMPPGVTGKDVIVALCGLMNNDDVLNHAIEFTGPAVRSIPIDERLTISNMTTEWGALSAIFPMDSTLEAWLRTKATTSAMLNPELGSKAKFTHAKIDELVQNPLAADPGATYAKSLYLDLSTLSPFVSGPNSVKVATPLNTLEAQDIKINKAYLVSCTNARASDFAAAAAVFQEAAAEDGTIPKIAPGVKFFIAAASLPEQQAAEESGAWQTLVDAGAHVLPSGCGPCIGLGAEESLLKPGDVGISASNRNYKGRMGSTEAKAYLASPEIVAASALKGKIAGPGWYKKPEGVEKVILGEGNGIAEQDKASSIEAALEKLVSQAESVVAGAEGTASGSEAAATENSDETLTDILPGFPEKVEGEILFCDTDNLSTDGIYGGKYTYRDDMTPEMMAEVCMENYDRNFRTIAREGDILVSGYNFGTGSSREQAATSILAKKIPLVVSGSFGNIFSRNSINNALLGMEVPKLVQRLREAFAGGEKVATRRTGWKFAWDVRRSTVTVTEGEGGKTWSQKVGELPPNVQEVIAKGGLEKWVKHQISLA